MTEQTKKVAFAWTDENTALVIDTYNTQKEVDLAIANSKKFLDDLADKIGAKSGQSVRSKLSSAKVYVKNEGTTAAPRKAKPTKVGLVRNVEAVLSAERGSLETLDKANVHDLETLTDLILALGTDEAIKDAYAALMKRKAIADESEMEECNTEETEA